MAEKGYLYSIIGAGYTHNSYYYSIMLKHYIYD